MSKNDTEDHALNGWNYQIIVTFTLIWKRSCIKWVKLSYNCHIHTHEKKNPLIIYYYTSDRLKNSKKEKPCQINKVTTSFENIEA